jgi:hypothetical protein
LKLYSLVGTFLSWLFLENVTRLAISIANEGSIIVATNYSATNTTFSTVVVVASLVSILLAMVISNIIIVVIIWFFICSIITMLSKIKIFAFIDMHVSNGSQNCVFVNAICYFVINLVPIKGVLLMNIFRID